MADTVQSNASSKAEMVRMMVRGEDAMAPWMTNVDCHSFEDFERYLAGQMRQAFDLRVHLEASGDEGGLLDWTNAKGAVFHEALLTFRLVMARVKANETISEQESKS